MASSQQVNQQGKSHPTQIDYSRAFLAGAIGGTLITLLITLARFAGVPINFTIFFGTLLGLPIGTFSTWLVGFVMHVLISGFIGIFYAWGFTKVPHGSNVGVGVAFALVHIVVGGLSIQSDARMP